MRGNRFNLCIGLLGMLWMISLQADPLQTWVMQDTAGKTHKLSGYRGQWLVVNYWAPWCPPCLEEMPELVAFYDEQGLKNVMVLGVAVQYKTEKSVTDFAEDMLISYPIILGSTQKKPVPQPEVLPTTYIYKPDGQLYKVKRGPVSKRWLEQLLKEAASGAESSGINNVSAKSR
ncbi:TlpA disulfide reductase family protein [Methylophilus sp. Leaf408]|uniref:TlpA disulfide reductase family protein n=1 Tax=Methylophilus sp. Leaf408 TaxID=2876561 RepID=UPI001E314CB8|nr:TlpA disulfide reductase family protein [Methylophilus sp. Leaf408]